MKILDKYIAKNFMLGYLIAFCVLLGLRIIIDLFINIDEFTEHAELGIFTIVRNVLAYYSLHSTLYFRDFAGMITIVAAAFSLGKMTRSNELIAVMASGVSLKRVIAPIVLLALLLTFLSITNQEFLIPSLADKLVRSHDDIPGRERYSVWFISDANGSLICAPQFDVKTATLHSPSIIMRRRTDDPLIWQVTGQISADKAVYNPQAKRWDLTNGRLSERSLQAAAFEPIDYYQTDIRPKDIAVSCKGRYKTLLSSRQLSAVASQKTQVKDLAQLYSQKHFRVTEPIINLVMLMISLPILVCRDPRTMKSAIIISFAATSACFVTTFACKMLATEAFLDRVIPELWAWLPILIFLPIAFIELDSMKT